MIQTNPHRPAATDTQRQSRDLLKFIYRLPLNHLIDLNISSLIWCSLIDCNWCISLDIALMLALNNHCACGWCFSVASFVIIIALACCPDVRRSHPTNIILLGLFVSKSLQNTSLGNAGYYRKYIQNYTCVATPLINLMCVGRICLLRVIWNLKMKQ